MQVPVINLAPYLEHSPGGKSAVPAEVAHACEEIGFFTIVGHGVPAALVQQTYEVTRRFFDLPPEQKLEVGFSPAGAGYSPIQGETLAASLGNAAPADLKESLNLGADFEQNLWPRNPVEGKQTWIGFFRAMEQLAANLLCIFAVALDLPEDFFDDKIDHPMSFLRLVNYPEQPNDPLPGQLRAGAHSDYGTLTILRSENAPGGLQVQHRNGEWLDVQVVPESFVINIGDLMMRWTNDRWVSTLHRVVNPPRDRRLGSRRQSMVFFHNPNANALVECLPGCCGPGRPARYPPITAGEHLMSKTRKAYGT